MNKKEYKKIQEKRKANQQINRLQIIIAVVLVVVAVIMGFKWLPMNICYIIMALGLWGNVYLSKKARLIEDDKSSKNYFYVSIALALFITTVAVVVLITGA